MSQPATSVVYANTKLGPDTVVGHFCVLGEPPKGARPGELPLSIGAGGVIRSHTVIYADVTIGDRLQTGHGVLIRNRTRIGDDCSVGSGSKVEFEVVMGNRVRLHSLVFVPEFSVLEDDCWLGPGVVLTNAKYPRSPHVKEQLAGVVVEAHAKIGAHATILPGVRIGRGALVGAGAVVTRDVPSWSVVVGNPARVVNTISNLPYGSDQKP